MDPTDRMAQRRRNTRIARQFGPIRGDRAPGASPVDRSRSSGT